ncbi:MAG: hypothetical protein H0T57_08510 [Rubrobacter sp.]|nr:hypothetical protein [Rubrobacter sp.]
MTEQIQQIEQANSSSNAEYNRSVEQIRNNPHLSEEGRSEALKNAYEKSMEKHITFTKKRMELKEKQREDLHGDLFRPGPGFLTETPQEQRERGASYRRSWMEADQLLEPNDEGRMDDRKLLRYLEAAQLAGDTLAEQAAFCGSVEPGC